MAIKKATQLVDVGWKRTATHFPHEFQWKKKEKRTTITFNEDAWPKKKEKRNNNKVRLGSLISCNYQTRWRLYERRISVRSLGPPPPHLPLLFISRFRRVLFFCFGGRKNTFPSRSSSFRFLYHCPGVLFYCFLADSIIHGVSTPLEMFFFKKKKLAKTFWKIKNRDNPVKVRFESVFQKWCCRFCKWQKATCYGTGKKRKEEEKKVLKKKNETTWGEQIGLVVDWKTSFYGSE